MQPDLLKEALAFAARGWLVFPVAPGAKRPVTENGYLDATRDPEKIRRWWTFRKGWERRNIGLVTSPESGGWVLDADVDKETGEFGSDTLASLEAVHGKLPPHPVAQTPSGGVHHFFAWPDDGQDLPRRIRFQAGLDALGMRGNGKGGYLIAPPSVRTDGPYKWIVSPDVVDAPQAPSWLLTLVRENVRGRPVDMPVIKPVRSERTNAYGRASLRALCEEIATAPFGQQDVTLVAKATRIGSIAYGGNIDIDEAFSATMAAGMSMASQKGREPWTQQAIEKKVRSSFAHAMKDPSPLMAGRTAEPPRQADRPRPQLVVSNQQAPNPEPIPNEQPQTDWRADEHKWMHGLPWQWKDTEVLKPSSIKNVQLMVEFHPSLKNMYRYDVFRDQVFIMHPLPGDDRTDYPRELSDHDETGLTVWLNWHGLAPGIQTVGAIIREIAFRHSFDPLKDWISGLEWDGEERVSGWLTRYAGAADGNYSRIVGTKFLIGAVARALEPGAKVDAMMIIEGPQNLGKSTLIRELCGADMFSDQVGDVTSKDSSERIQGCWIVEIPEMDKFSRHEANSVKDFLSRREDRYRPAYGRNVIKRPRRSVFFGTINPDGIGYLKDSTGNRRFWPVTVSQIDLDGIRADRDQIWAEAVYRYRNGEEWWISTEDAHLVEPEQEARRDDDVWEPKIGAWLEDRMNGRLSMIFTSADCLKDALGIDIGKQGQREKIRVAKVLAMYGCWQQNNKAGIKGRSWVYERKV